MIWGALLFFILSVVFFFKRQRNKYSASEQLVRSTLPKEKVRTLLQKFGTNGNSFLTLYDGFSYFQASEKAANAVVAYCNSRKTLIGATEPMCESPHIETALKEFRSFARDQGKNTILLPISDSAAQTAKTAGFGRLMIGFEPVFELDKYSPDATRFQGAKHMISEGAKVEEFFPATLSEDELNQCNQITHEWLRKRKIPPLGFVNTVTPWALSEDKKYFLLRHQDRILAFVAAIPIWGRNGWYLIDLMRLSQSPHGGTELLILETLKLLKRAGAKEVTMGVAPLSGLEFAPTDGEHPYLYRMLKFAFSHLNLFYRFEPLYQFKLKFGPTRCDRSFVIYSNKNIKLDDTLALLEVFIPGGILNATFVGTLRFLTEVRLLEVFRKRVRASIVLRAVPRNFWERLQRTRVTFALIAFDLIGSLTHAFKWDPHYVAVRAVGTLFVAGLLETLAGSRVLAVSFAGGCLVLPLVWGPLHLASTEALFSAAGMGVFGCGGTLTWFLSRGNILFLVFSAVLGAAAVLTHSTFPLCQLAALYLGAGAARVYLGR